MDFTQGQLPNTWWMWLILAVLGILYFSFVGYLVSLANWAQTLIARCRSGLRPYDRLGVLDATDSGVNGDYHSIINADGSDATS